ncbi:histidine-rich glycoprotein [Lucilia cuprina]|uniref:histidine-rich glycoprotein n=1 Tax=Lucilia cuprina TaxID=7375 RepID=UPI001F064224|nr:histidine-rich glycoprotein [Lucilia cuprina]
MDISKIITICAFCTIFGMEFVLSSPTFGSEHVHIKVHIPHEHSSGKGIVKSKHPVIHHVPKHHVKHKIIHHYHQIPVKTVVVKEKAPLLENHYLAELDRPHNHEHSYQHDHSPKHIEETYVIKEQHKYIKPVKEVNTVKVEEEYEQHQPHHEYGQNHIETIKLIESDQNHHYHEDHGHHHQHQPHHEYGHNHIETIKLVESAQDHHYHEGHNHHVKFVEEKPQYHYQHKEMPGNYDYRSPKEEVIKVIQAPKYIHSHYVHEPQVKEVVEEEEVIETKSPAPKGYYKNHDIEDHLLPDIIEESLEIFETKKAKNHNYENNNYKTHYGYQQSKGEVISKPYYHYQKVPATNYHYSPKEHDEEQIVYEKPSSHYHYTQHTQSAAPESSHHYTTHSGDYEEDSHHDSQHKYVTDYEKYLPSSETPQDFNVPHKEYQKQNTLYEDFNTKDDYSNDGHAANPAETYTGHDSYSAGHVQGLGSGGYRNHMP